MVPTAGLCVSLRVLPRHVFMPFQTALAVSRSLQALGFARTFGPVRGSSWGGAEAGERLPVRCLRRAGHSPRVTSRPLGGRHVVHAADIISRSANRRKGQDNSHTCRRAPCFTAHATPPWLACADVAQMAHTSGVTRLRARSNDQGGSRLAVVSWQGNPHQVAALGHSSQPSISDAASSVKRNTSASSGVPFRLRHWLRTSAANSGVRVSGTQNWTGRNPAARIRARWRVVLLCVS